MKSPEINMTVKQKDYLSKLQIEIVSTDAHIHERTLGEMFVSLTEPLPFDNTLWPILGVIITGRDLKFRLLNPNGAYIELHDKIPFQFTYIIKLDAENFLDAVKGWINQHNKKCPACASADIEIQLSREDIPSIITTSNLLRANGAGSCNKCGNTWDLN